MTSVKVTALSGELSYGARITGINQENAMDPAIRKQINDIFEDRGMIVFHEVENSSDMQIVLSEIFGPSQDYAIKEIDHADAKPGLIEFNYRGDIVDANGKLMLGWVPWHFDACYAEKLNRGGVLRPVQISPEGGLTGFADGIQLYNAVSPALRAKFEDLKVIYHLKLMFWHQRFGMPKDYRWTELSDTSLGLIEAGSKAQRTVHPVVWERKSGEKVLHISPWQAAGIYGRENSEGDALLESLCQEMYARMTPYWHKWEPTDMVIWDNWRFIHSVSGNDPKYERCMRRTTIKGDYGLGCYEQDAPTNSRHELVN